MADEPEPALVALRDRREAVIRVLENGYAVELLDDAAFEARIAKAHCARSIADLDALVSDLEVPAPTTTLVKADGPALVPVRPTILSLFSSVERRVSFALPPALTTRALFGSAVLDLRDAQLGLGARRCSPCAPSSATSRPSCPHELAVVCDGTAIFASFEHAGQTPVADPERPLLRIVGSAVFGSVEVRVRPRGVIRKALLQIAQKLLGDEREGADVGEGSLVAVGIVSPSRA